jgi:hypothetical protein
VVPGGEPGHDDDIADDGGGDDRPDAEDLGEAGAGYLDRGGQLRTGFAAAGIKVADVGQQFGGEPVRWRAPPPRQRLQLPNLRLFDPALRAEPVPLRQAEVAMLGHLGQEPDARLHRGARYQPQRGWFR